MSSEKITINTSTLGNDADKIQSLITDIEKELTSMESDIKSLGTMWEGEAKQAFMTNFEQDRTILQSLIKELKDLHNYETNAKKQYETCENNVGKLIADIHLSR